MRRITLMWLLMSLACGGHYPTSTPPEARVLVEMPTLAALTAEEQTLWVQHMSASLAWELRESQGCRYAVRLQPTERGGVTVYESTLNGYYADASATDVVQTRVVMGLGCEHGFGQDRGQITRAAASAGEVQLILEDNMSQPGLSSALLITGGQGTTVEIYEQAHPSHRAFTAAAAAAIEDELRALLSAQDELAERCVVEHLVPPGSTQTGAPSLAVTDGMQPGIYQLTAWVNPGESATVEARVFAAGPAGDRPVPEEVGAIDSELSAARLRARSRRLVAGCQQPERLFRYQSEVTLYEGDWGQPYRARFELWHIDSGEGGEDVLLVSTTRQVEGWMQ